MKDKISNILVTLKRDKKIPASKIEEELGLSNGVLGKTARGIKGLSEENYNRVIEYYEKIMGEPLPDPQPEIITDRTQTVVTKKGEMKVQPSKKISSTLQAVMDKINKDFGAGSIMRLGDAPLKSFEVISTGSLRIDEAIGIGGLPRGRIVEVYGAESGGKTTLCLQTIAQAQKKGFNCAFIDAENSFSPEHAESLDVDVPNLFVSQPSHGEEALETADRLVESGEYAVIVIDSVAALIPKAELEGQMGESKMGLHARLMSQACRKLTTSIARTNTLVIFINQIREKIGVQWGNPETTTGGNALKFFASVRLDMRRLAQIKDGDEVIGNLIKATIVKNKCAPPFKKAETRIIYGKGIDLTYEIVTLAVERGIIQKSGSWFSYETDKLGQGENAVIALLEDNPSFKNEIEQKVRNYQPE